MLKWMQPNPVYEWISLLKLAKNPPRQTAAVYRECVSSVGVCGGGGGGGGQSGGVSCLTGDPCCKKLCEVGRGRI
jgi:hypothetical protein